MEIRPRRYRAVLILCKYMLLRQKPDKVIPYINIMGTSRRSFRYARERFVGGLLRSICGMHASRKCGMHSSIPSKRVQGGYCKPGRFQPYYPIQPLSSLHLALLFSSFKARPSYATGITDYHTVQVIVASRSVLPVVTAAQHVLMPI